MIPFRGLTMRGQLMSCDRTSALNITAGAEAVIRITHLQHWVMQFQSFSAETQDETETLCSSSKPKLYTKSEFTGSFGVETGTEIRSTSTFGNSAFIRFRPEHEISRSDHL